MSFAIGSFAVPFLTGIVLLFSCMPQYFASIQYVTCGSLVKLVHTDYRVRLHSHDVKYGSGSGQQSVTAVQDIDDANSYWQVIGKHNAPQCTRGQEINCGDTVRLLHVNTNRYLHTHLHEAPLTNGYKEVSAFGENGRSDTGDNWVVVCSSDVWRRDDDVKLKHVDTEMFLTVTGSVYGRPIKGQYEVAATKRESRSCYWKTSEGAFIKPDDGPTKVQNSDDDDSFDDHDEL